MTRNCMFNRFMNASATQCAEASFACTSFSAASIAIILDTVLVSIFVALISLLGLIGLLVLLVVSVLLVGIIIRIHLLNSCYYSKEQPLFIC